MELDAAAGVGHWLEQLERLEANGEDVLPSEAREGGAVAEGGLPAVHLGGAEGTG